MSGIYILNDACYLTTYIGANFTGALEAIHMSRTLCLFHNTCYNHPYYYKRSVVDSRKIEWYVCLRKTIVALLSWRCLFIPIHSYLFEKCCTKCTEVLAATPLFVGECVNLQFHNSNCSYCRHLHLQGWLTEQLLSPKNYSFKVLIALTFFCGTVVCVIFCLILMRIFQNSPNKLHINSGSEKIASPRFHAVSFVCS